jgi:hypothetical protein
MPKRTPAPKPSVPEPLPAAPRPLAIPHLYWIAPFALFLALRLFSGDPFYLLAGDQCTFLQLARTFPKHQLFNHELYLIHSPLFGYTIGIVHLVLPLLTSGLVATLLFACLNFFALRALARFENMPPAAICAGLILLALSRPAVAYDYHVARVSILVCSTTLALLAALRMFREPSHKTELIAIAANSFALLVSDQALLLLPCEALLWWARAPRTAWKPAALLALASTAAALIWPAVRLLEFLKRSDLPAGISGTIEFTRDFPLLALLQPNLLPFTNAQRSLFTQTSLSLWNLKPAPIASLPTDLLLLPRAVSAAIVLLLLAAALARPQSRSRALQWLALSLLFLLPVGLGMNEWYGMPFIVPFSLLMMEGAAACIAWRPSFAADSRKTLTIALSLACILAVALWLTAPAPAAHDLVSPRGGTHFLFTRPAVTRSAALSQFFAPMPRNVGIMAPTDLSPELGYLTDKRVVALPFNPALLDTFIAEYRISYLVTSNEFFRRYDSAVADQYTSSMITRYIVENSGKYRLVQVQPEKYPAFYPALEYYVFQVETIPGRGGPPH